MTLERVLILLFTAHFLLVKSYNSLKSTFKYIITKNKNQDTLSAEIRTRKSITYNYMLYKGVVVSKINNHYSIIYLGLTN